LFEPFFTTREDGLGMGLAICRRIVEARGGRIWAENTDSGARFCFTLPLAESEPQRGSAAEPGSSQSTESQARPVAEPADGG
jgi:K+-sensing histidine kinase KdpD